MSVGSGLIGVLVFALALAAAVLAMIFLVVPLFRLLGRAIAGLFKGIGFLIVHVFEFVRSMIGDTLRFIGAVLAVVLLAPMTLINLVIGRWSAAGHFAESVKREFTVGALSLYRVALRNPLRLLFLHGLLEGIEQRVPEAMAAAPTSDRPSKRVGQFPGYTIVGSLRSGGSGAKLYVAGPEPAVLAKYPGMPERVVIKSFALSEGSSLPQIVRESRALECAKQLGLVFEHGMDSHRFFYVMPYHGGDHLGIVTRQLHGEAGTVGLGRKELATALGYVDDLVATLSRYHRGGLWHKDVKPENIIINDGRAHLVDLGLITPLRSAMTLTTHGTEYFRDPEMVRQALRGAKVHQINGAKFDIYAAGAVLYFLIENTFPPHGALSRFTRKSPDALRWIVRRSMADYTHRYESADDLLDDLRHVASSKDFFGVRPADLPSMRGRRPADSFGPEVAPEAPALEPVSVARAGSPVPPPIPERPTAAPARAAQRPKIKVTNWWTGAYRVDDGNAVVTPARVTPEMLREEARMRRHEAADLREKVRAGAMSPRRAAKEQIKSARARARDMRKRAKEHRHRAVAERQPSAALVLVSLATLAVVGAGVVGTIAASRGRHPHPHAGAHAQVVAPEAAPEAPARPVLLVNTVRDRGVAATSRRVKEIARDFRSDGYDVILDDPRATADLRGLLEEWHRTKSEDAEAHDVIDRALRVVLMESKLHGLVVVTEAPDGDLDASLIAAMDPEEHLALFAGPSLPYLLVNDHPTKHDPEVARRIAERIDAFREAGWVIEADDDLEVSVRKALPTGRLEPGAPLSPVLRVVTAESGLAGIVYVTAAAGEGSAAERIEISRIEFPPLESPPALPAAADAADPAVADPAIVPVSAPERSDAGKDT